MKKFKILAMASLFAVATNASAQFTNTTRKSPSSSVGTNVDGWSTLWVEWNPSLLKYDVKNADDASFTGFSVGYSQAFSVAPSLFMEVGGGIQYLSNNESIDSEDTEIKTNLVSAKVPVNLIYAFQIPNSSVSLLPFVGANLRYNLSGKQKYEYDDYDDYDYDYDYYGYDDYDYDDENKESNLFDKDDMGGSSYTWKRLQIGYQIGVKARFGESFLVSLSYGSDLSEIAKKAKFSTTSITIGYTF